MDQQPAKRKRSNGRPNADERERIEANKERWLQEFRTKGWDGACAAVGVAASTPSNWRLTDPAFRAKHEALTPLVAEDLERLVEECIAGKRTLDKVQMTLLIFRLKALKPSLYRERWSVEHSGPDGGSIKVEQTGEQQHGMTLLRQWGGRLAGSN
jgi:hypothetical protein